MTDAQKKQATRAKSLNSEREFEVGFRNDTNTTVDVIWKNFDGDEEVLAEKLEVGETHKISTFFTHCFIVRDSDSQELRYFHLDSTSSVVFEGFNFGVDEGGSVMVDISEQDKIGLEEEKERMAAEFRSIKSEKKFTVCFTNETNGNVDLIWKNFDGEEEVMRQDIEPGKSHDLKTFFTHHFIARDSETQELRSICLDLTASVAFEGRIFGVKKGEEVAVAICDPAHLGATEEAESLVAESKSTKSKKEFTAIFRNDTHTRLIDLIWKNFEGEEEVITQGVEPGVTLDQITFFTHPFIARDSETQELLPFNLDTLSSLVFEEERFGVEKGEEVTIGIC